MSTDQQHRSGDDNIITRRKHVKESLNVIRDKKERLHAAIKAVSAGEQPDKEMIAKLIDAYDQMTAQENQYLEILKNIVEIHEMAVDDVAKEIEEKKKSLPVGEEGPKEEAKEDAVQEKTQLDIVLGQNDEELSELEATLRELHEVSAAAAAASKLHDQLVERLQLQKSKKTTLNEIRKDKTADMRKQANDVLTEVEIAKLKVHTEKSAKDRKEKQLDRLRKEALKRGIQLGAQEEKEKEEMIAAVETSGERIPQVESKEDETPVEEEPTKTEEERMEEKRKEIRENVRREREKKEQVNQQIRERLKAMEARKERVRQLRIALQQSAESPETEEQARQALDDMFSNAAANLANLTAMRERLEAMQLNGQTDEQQSTPSPTDEIEREVRQQFATVMQISEPQRNNQQLDRIESLLKQQSVKLDEMTRAPSVYHIRQSLLSSPPALLQGLADCLLQLAAGQPVPQLDAHLHAVLGGAEPTKGPRNASAVTFGLHEDRREQQQLGAEDIAPYLSAAARKLLEETELVDTGTAQRLRQMTCHLVGRLFPNVAVEACEKQLGEQVHDIVSQYLDMSVQDCVENVVYDLEELFRNELSYYCLMNSLNTIPDTQ